MGGVAIVAGDAVVGVSRVAELSLIAAALVALLAALGVLLRIGPEGEDQLVGDCGFGVVSVGGLLCVGMSFAPAVARLAVHRRPLVGGADACVPRLRVLTELGLVAGAAAIRAHVSAVLRGRGKSR